MPLQTESRPGLNGQFLPDSSSPGRLRRIYPKAEHFTMSIALTLPIPAVHLLELSHPQFGGGRIPIQRLSFQSLPVLNSTMPISRPLLITKQRCES